MNLNTVFAETEYVGDSFTERNGDAELFAGKQFYDCHFENCSLIKANFRNCRFVDCYFSRCDLSSIKFEGSTFRGTRFEDSKLIGVDWTIVSWPTPTMGSSIRFYQCALDFSNFFGLALHEVTFERSSVKEVEFSEADLSAANFRGALLTNSRFNQTNLTHADFREATEYSIDVTNNVIANAKFTIPEAISLLRGLDIDLGE